MINAPTLYGAQRSDILMVPASCTLRISLNIFLPPFENTGASYLLISAKFRDNSFERWMRLHAWIAFFLARAAYLGSLSRLFRRL